MIWEKLAQKSTSYTAFLVALVFLVFAFLDLRYRYFCLCVAILCFIYGFKKLKKRDTPFERHERETRRKEFR